MDSSEIRFAAMLSLPWSRTMAPWKPVKRPYMVLKSMGSAFTSHSVSFPKHACTIEILLIKCW